MKKDCAYYESEIKRMQEQQIVEFIHLLRAKGLNEDEIKMEVYSFVERQKMDFLMTDQEPEQN